MLGQSDPVQLNRQMCQSLLDELAFLAERLNDPVAFSMAQAVQDYVAVRLRRPSWDGEVTFEGVVRSVIDSGKTDSLAGTTSMHDLIVVPTPVPAPPYGVVIVRAPGSLANPPAGKVVVEHQSGTGRDDKIERPVDEAVPLFWRSMIEKFGVSPGQSR